MKAQLYLVKIQKDDELAGKLAASPVYLNNNTDDIIGIVVEDLKKMGSRTICLFQPTQNPDILSNISTIIDEELDFSEIKPLIDLAISNAPEEQRGIKTTFWENVYADLKSRRESMRAPPSLADIVTRRI